MKNYLKLLALLSIVVLTACAASNDVISIGPETYSLRRDNGVFSSLGALKAAAYKDAAAFCAAKQKTVQVVGSTDVPRSYGQFPETEVRFTCV